MNLINQVKLKILNNVLNSLSVIEITDVIEAFGQKQFGKEKNEYLDQIRTKLANVVFEIGKRMGRET